VAKPPRANSKSQLEARIRQLAPGAVDPETAARLRLELGLPETRFRKLIREAGVPLHPVVEGVRQNSLDDCARTLTALDFVAPEFPIPVRQEILRARQHARFAQARHPTPDRAEMILWMTVWLENQPVFAEWLRLRREAIAGGS
jgi:hypothetical protein